MREPAGRVETDGQHLPYLKSYLAKQGADLAAREEMHGHRAESLVRRHEAVARGGMAAHAAPEITQEPASAGGITEVPVAVVDVEN